MPPSRFLLRVKAVGGGTQETHGGSPFCLQWPHPGSLPRPQPKTPQGLLGWGGGDGVSSFKGRRELSPAGVRLRPMSQLLLI